MLIDAIGHVGELVVKAAIKGVYIGAKIAKAGGTSITKGTVQGA